MTAFCEGISDKSLSTALLEGYSALLEAKVCKELQPIFNWLLQSGDWVYKSGGTHSNRLQINVAPELLPLVDRLIRDGKINPKDEKAFKLGIIFTSTPLSYRRAIDGILSEIRGCYQIAAALEHAYYGHRGQENAWLRKGNEFTEKFMEGRALDTTGSEYSTDAVAGTDSSEEPDMITVTGEDGQTWQVPNWKKHQALEKKKKLMQSSHSIPGTPMMEGIFSDFGKRLARGIVAAAMIGGFMAGNANAADTSKKASPGYGKEKTEVNVKTTKTKSGTFTSADLSNLYMSEAYNKRVSQLVDEELKRKPNGDIQFIYDFACLQAMEEIVSGKLKP